MGNGYASGLFRDDDCDGIGCLSDAEGGTVAQSEGAGNGIVVADGKNTSGSRDAVVGNDCGPVVERRVFEEDVFEESGVYLRIDDVAGLFVGGKVDHLFDDNEGPGSRARHVHHGIDNGHDPLTLPLFGIVFLAFKFAMEETAEYAPSLI